MFLSAQCMDNDYDVEFADKNPMFRGYTKTNCMLLQSQKTLAAAYNCCVLYSNGLPGVPFCSPLEQIAIWNPDNATLQRR